MTKSIKRILAVALAIVMIALMIPFSASAAETYSFTVSCAKDGFEFQVYELAQLKSTTTGELVIGDVDDSVKAAINSATDTNSKAKAIISACDAATKIGTQVGEKFVSGSADKTYSVGGGIYYIKCTKSPEGASVSNSLVSLPYYNGTSWVTTVDTINLAGKVGSVKVGKKIVENGNDVTYTSASVGDTVTFKLTSSVPGTVTDKLTKFIITDTMDEGLSAEDVNITSVKQGSTDLSYEKVEVSGCTFGVKINDEELKKESFYQNGNVTVTFTTKVTNKATIGNSSNDNSDGLVYANNQGEQTAPGETVQVFTFNVQVKKVDAANTSKTLKGATFELYDNEACTGAALATAATGEDGTTNFNGMQLKAGTYYVKETAAPAGYILDSTPKAIEINPEYNTSTSTVTVGLTNGTAEITVKNVTLSAPSTGGMGTIMFTISGAILIAAAGVMFIILKRKKTTK